MGERSRWGYKSIEPVGIAALLDRDPARAVPIDGTPWRWSFAGAAVEIAIEDELGKIDLNAASDTLLHDLFRAQGVGEREQLR